MALKATIYKADLQIADMDRGYYGDHALTIAQHPSENDERLMVRLLAYALYAAGEDQHPLSFGNGMTDNDEPDLWRRNLIGEIELWIDVGQPDEKLLRKAHHRSRELVLITFGRVAEIWWEQNRRELEKLERLRVLQLAEEYSKALAELAQRTMRLQVTVQDGQVWIGGDGDASVMLELVEWKAAAGRR